MMTYTGVGSRETPSEVLTVMSRLAGVLSHEGWTLRSGGAKGADRAFEAGAGIWKQIFHAEEARNDAAAAAIAQNHHPAWHLCSEYARLLHTRNVYQVLGRNIDSPSRFLICWTPDGCISTNTRTRYTGGTGTAISIADTCNIPVFNLQREEHMERIMHKLNKETKHG